MPTPTRKSIITSTVGELTTDEKEQFGLSDELKERIQERESDTRQRIAILFVYIYFALLTIILVGMPLYNLLVYQLTHNKDLIIPVTDMVQTYSAVVGPTLGFVIAYYFKNKGE